MALDLPAIEAKHVQFAEKLLDGATPRFVGWVAKLKDDDKPPPAAAAAAGKAVSRRGPKPQARLIVVGDRLLYSAKSTLLGGLSVARAGHLHDLTALGGEGEEDLEVGEAAPRPPHPQAQTYRNRSHLRCDGLRIAFHTSAIRRAPALREAGGRAAGGVTRTGAQLWGSIR